MRKYVTLLAVVAAGCHASEGDAPPTTAAADKQAPAHDPASLWVEAKPGDLTSASSDGVVLKVEGGLWADNAAAIAKSVRLTRASDGATIAATVTTELYCVGVVEGDKLWCVKGDGAAAGVLLKVVPTGESGWVEVAVTVPKEVGSDTFRTRVATGSTPIVREIQYCLKEDGIGRLTVDFSESIPTDQLGTASMHVEGLDCKFLPPKGEASAVVYADCDPATAVGVPTLIFSQILGKGGSELQFGAPGKGLVAAKDVPVPLDLAGKTKSGCAVVKPAEP